MLGGSVKIVSGEKIRPQHMILEITPILRYVLIHPRIKHWREIDHDVKMELWGFGASVLHFPAYNKYFKMSSYYPDSCGGNEHYYPFSQKGSRAGYGARRG